MFFYLYKITLLKGKLAGHYYYGRHKTKKLDDNYAGSGIQVTNYYKKYGKIEHQTYIKDIIAFYDNDKELNEAEIKYIGDKYKTDELCLNLAAGCNKDPWNKGKHLSEETKSKISNSHKGLQQSEETKSRIGDAKRGKKQSSEHISKRMQSKIKNGNSKHSDLTKNKISISKTGKHRHYIDEIHYVMV